MAHRSRNNGATLGFEETLWRAADKMRGHMDPSEYKNVIREDYYRGCWH